MKRVLALCVLALIILSTNIVAFAVPDGFTKSPGGMPKPKIIDFDPDDHDCDAAAVIASWAELGNMPEESAVIFEAAYDSIIAVHNIKELNSGLIELAKSMHIHEDNLAISDFFDIYPIGCSDHEVHKHFNLVLEMEALKNYVCLLAYDFDNSEWLIVPDATVSEDGTILSFSVDKLCPLAVVVNTNKIEPSPQTGDSSMLYIYLLVMLLCVIAVAAISVKSKKQKA